MTLKSRLGRIGIWSLELRFGDPGEAVDAATGPVAYLASDRASFVTGQVWSVDGGSLL